MHDLAQHACAQGRVEPLQASAHEDGHSTGLGSSSMRSDYRRHSHGGPALVIVAGTIVARNYLAQAQVLVDSFREHHPDGTFDVLLIEDRATQGPTMRGARSSCSTRSGSIPVVLARMTVAYELVELATAVKPWLFAACSIAATDHAVYFDPDILHRASGSSSPGPGARPAIVLTPHLTEPMPRDGGMPNEQSLLLAGSYNLGFIGVG